LVQQLAQAKRSFEVGTVPVTDFNEAQSRHDLAVAQEIASRNDLEGKKNVLEKSLAKPLPPLARLTAQANTELLSDEDQRALMQRAAQTALQVAIAHSALRVAEREVAKRDAAHLPTLDLVLAARNDTGVNATPFGSSQTRQSSIGVEFAVPIYQGGALTSRTREAVADQQRAEQELSNAQRQAELDARQALLGVQSGSALTRALRQALTSSETQLKSTQRGLQVGVRTRVDVLNAEQQVYATRKDLAAARYRTLVSALQLKAAAGALQDTDVRAMDALLAE
jgi:outer membrane protein